MSLSAILNLTLWQRCANGLLGKHVSAMYITNMRNVRFLVRNIQFLSAKNPQPPPNSTSLSGSFSERYMRRLVEIKKCYSAEGAGSVCLDILVVNNLNYSGSTCSRSSHEICELKVKYRPSRSRWLLAPFGELHCFWQVWIKIVLRVWWISGEQHSSKDYVAAVATCDMTADWMQLLIPTINLPNKYRHIHKHVAQFLKY